MADHEVISAFLDDEPFDPQELSEALADPAGRALLIDLVTLRRLAQPEDVPSVLTRLPPRRAARPVRILAVAAALVLAVVGGYQWGERSSDSSSADPPAPTRVVRSETGWQDVANGGSR